MLKYVLLFGLICHSANAQVTIYYNYASWEGLPDGLRKAYIAGAIDSLASWADTASNKKMSEHILSCLKTTNITLTQLGDNLKTYTSVRPKLRPGSVQAALIDYLNALCGEPKP
jgi:hypothetical protein